MPQQPEQSIPLGTVAFHLAGKRIATGCVENDRRIEEPPIAVLRKLTARGRVSEGCEELETSPQECCFSRLTGTEQQIPGDSVKR